MYHLFNILDKPIILDTKTSECCERNGHLFAIKDYCELIVRHFDSLKDIRITLQSDYDIPNYEKLRFDVLVDDSVGGVLEKEELLRKDAQNAIAQEILKEFVLITRICPRKGPEVCKNQNRPG